MEKKPNIHPKSLPQPETQRTSALVQSMQGAKPRLTAQILESEDVMISLALYWFSFLDLQMLNQQNLMVFKSMRLFKLDWFLLWAEQMSFPASCLSSWTSFHLFLNRWLPLLMIFCSDPIPLVVSLTAAPACLRLKLGQHLLSSTHRVLTQNEAEKTPQMNEPASIHHLSALCSNPSLQNAWTRGTLVRMKTILHCF